MYLSLAKEWKRKIVGRHNKLERITQLNTNDKTRIKKLPSIKNNRKRRLCGRRKFTLKLRL